MKIPNINFDLDQTIEDLAIEMDGADYMESNACSIIKFPLPDGRWVEVQLVLKSNEFEFISE